MGDQALLQEHKHISDKMSAYDFRDACEAGDFDKAKGLIKSVDINETDEYGFTGLHMASENGHLKIVEELVAAGAKLDPLVFDSYLLPLHMAINKNHTAIAKLLIEKGAKLDEKSYSGACCAPIHYAILKENQEIFKLLMSKKCDINIPDDINGNSPLFLATTLKQIDTMKAPIVQKPAPAFKAQAVVDGQFKEVSLADYAGKYVVVYFYPLDFTFVCPTEIIAFSDRIQEFKEIDAEVIGISTDSHFSH